jgi:hypothetical protein
MTKRVSLASKHLKFVWVLDFVIWNLAHGIATPRQVGAHNDISSLSLRGATGRSNPGGAMELPRPDKSGLVMTTPLVVARHSLLLSLRGA